ncbi:uncharacterized protein LOC124544935 [Schistocerca americana]|uniref:uncharacterized protein LOC124544935 n=1 Tax=Schistocerca americana TaxID=7009 RepID=UPI001F4FE55C|nr:uncharacterized protein LOC124544935 [Schistocerca americana]
MALGVHNWQVQSKRNNTVPPSQSPATGPPPAAGRSGSGRHLSGCGAGAAGQWDAGAEAEAEAEAEAAAGPRRLAFVFVRSGATHVRCTCEGLERETSAVAAPERAVCTDTGGRGSAAAPGRPERGAPGPAAPYFGGWAAVGGSRTCSPSVAAAAAAAAPPPAAASHLLAAGLSQRARPPSPSSSAHAQLAARFSQALHRFSPDNCAADSVHAHGLEDAAASSLDRLSLIVQSITPEQSRP